MFLCCKIDTKRVSNSEYDTGFHIQTSVNKTQSVEFMDVLFMNLDTVYNTAFYFFQDAEKAEELVQMTINSAEKQFSQKSDLPFVQWIVKIMTQMVLSKDQL